MNHSPPIVLFTGVQRLARSLRQKGFASACLYQPGEVIPSPDEVDILILYDPEDLPALEVWAKKWSLRDRVMAIINRREKRVFEHAHLNRAFHKDGVDLRQARILRDKLYLREALAAIAPHLNPPYEAVDLTVPSKPGLPFPLLLKPRNLFKSQLITLCRTHQEWEHARGEMPSKLEPASQRHGVALKASFLAEAFVDGREVSLDAFITPDGEMIPTPLVALTPARHWDMEDFHVAMRHLPADFTPKDEDLVLNVVRETIHALELRATPVHIDLVLEDNEVNVLDVAPRVGGYRSEMMDLAFGCPLDPMNLGLALGETPSWQPRLQHGVAVVEVFPPRPGRLAGIHGLKRIKAFRSFRRFRQRIRVGEAVGWARDGFRCPIFVILAHRDPDVVLKEAEEIRYSLELEVTAL